MDDEPKYNFAPWWTFFTIFLLFHQDNWMVDKCSYVSTKNCITLLGDMFAGRGIMRSSLLFQIPRLITMWYLLFCYLFQHLPKKLTLLRHCKLTIDSEKENFTGKNWTNNPVSISRVNKTGQRRKKNIYMYWFKNSLCSHIKLLEGYTIAGL